MRGRAGDSSDMLRSDDLMVPGLKCPGHCQWSPVRIQRDFILFQIVFVFQIRIL